MLDQANILLLKSCRAHTGLWVISTIAIAVPSAIVLLLSYDNNGIQSSAGTQDSNNNLRKERSIVGGHTPGYGVIETSGDILDPISLNITLKNAAVDPVKYLHEFDYGRVVGSWMLRSHSQHQEIKEKKDISVNIFVIGGFAVGIAIMYVTGLLV
jgi:hypothetical protein